MLGNLTGWHLLIIVAILLLLFSATKLPTLARSVGQSAKIFRSEMASDAPVAEPAASSATTVAATADRSATP